MLPPSWLPLCNPSFVRHANLSHSWRLPNCLPATPFSLPVNNHHSTCHEYCQLYPRRRGRIFNASSSKNRPFLLFLVALTYNRLFTTMSPIRVESVLDRFPTHV